MDVHFGWPDVSPLRVLCVGAHSDDIEIGSGGTVLRLLHERGDVELDWVVLSADGARRDEAERSAAAFLEGAARAAVRVEAFRERYFPWQPELKEYFDGLGRSVAPHIVLAPRCDDLHQDHRSVAELVWQTFRDHLIFEYEIPKYEGDLGRPNVYVPLAGEVVERKVELLLDLFPSQRARPWFDAETFRSLPRLRGLECRAPDGYAEAFTARKVVV